MRIVQAWGMTETSPLASVAHPPAGAARATSVRRARAPGRPAAAARRGADRRRRRRGGRLGRRVDRRARGPRAVDRPRVLRGPGRRREVPRRLAAHRRRRVDRRPTGSIRITDRAKDVIKSGGEWISSVDLENALMAHPDVREAAVIAKPDERWSERPLACVVRQRGRDADAPRSCASTSPSASPSGGCPTSSRSSTRSRRRASASSTRRCLRTQLADGGLLTDKVGRQS